ncbi:hypothetical protein [Streptomyces sp. NPDC049879]|uniref:maltokinase N-terminal cap-like domain-containing protein n=1 Tax=Streptomyces sp. NPDC049879 TaxID=3365598 RepID=UPI0037948F34
MTDIHTPGTPFGAYDPRRVEDVLRSAAFRAALADWLTGQRWFAATNGRLPHPEILRTYVFHRAGSTGLIALVRDGAAAGGDTGPYQIPLAVGAAVHQPPGVAPIARIGDVFVWDALSDPGPVSTLIRHMAGGRTLGSLAFRAEPPGFAPPRGPVRVRPPGGEQTNTSVVVGERYILKVYRRPLPGANPDLVLHRMLRDAGSRHVPPLLGSLESTAQDGPAYTLATLQSYLPEAASGWDLALENAVSGDFTGEAARLGEAVAAVHSDLAAAGGSVPLGARDYEALAESFLSRLDQALTVVPRLRTHAARLRTLFGRVAGLDPGAGRLAQLVHGDLHLGQTLRTADGWLLLDFEGEPLAAGQESAAVHSPLRDVAGMLRSFDYAAHQGLNGAETGFPELMRRRAAARRWAGRSVDAFWRGYARAAGRDRAGDLGLLRAYVLDKAVYEVLYETTYRPGWAWIPLGFLGRALPRDVIPTRRPTAGPGSSG